MQNRFFNKISLLFYFSLIIYFNSLSQDFNYKFYTKNNSSLIDNTILSFKEDKQGNVWVATARGLSRFDGEKWKLWNYVDSTQYGLDSTFTIWCLDIDSHNNKWLATNVGLFKLDTNEQLSLVQQGSFVSVAVDLQDKIWFGGYNSLNFYDGINFSTIKDNDPNFNFALVSSIQVDRNNIKWVILFGQSSDKRLLKITDLNIEKISVPNNNYQFQCMQLDNQNNVWLGTESEGVCYFNGKDWVNYNVSNSGLKTHFITSIDIEKDSIVWIGTNEGMYSFDGKTWKQTIDNSLLIGQYVTSILVKENNDKWIGNFNGITAISKRKCDTIIFNSIISNSTTICKGSDLHLTPKNANFDVFRWSWKVNNVEFTSNNKELNTNELEVGTYDFNLKTIDHEGCVMPSSSTKINIVDLPKVSILSSDSIIFRSSNKLSSKASPSGGVFTLDGVELSKLNLSNSSLGFKDLKYEWADSIGCIGTTNKIIELVDSVKYQQATNFVHFTNSNSGLINNNINCIQFDNKSACLIGTNKGLARFDGTNWESFTTLNSLLLSDTINGIDIDSSGFIWVATKKGINILNSEFKFIKTLSFNSSNYKLVIDKDNTKWVGSKNGLIRITLSDTTIFNQLNSMLKSDEITTLFCNNNVVMVGTLNGLYRYNLYGGYFENEYSSTFYTSITDNKINSVSIDQKDNIWFGTDKGLNKLNYKVILSSGIEIYDLFTFYNSLTSGLVNDTITSLNIADSNLLLVGTKKGFTIYDGDKWQTLLSQKRSDTDFEISVISVDKTGTLWIGTTNGLYKILKDKSLLKKENPISSISIYPNPTDDRFTINNLNITTQVRVVDVFGKIVYDKTFTENKIEVELNQIATKGLYVVQCIQNGEIINSTKVMLN